MTDLGRFILRRKLAVPTPPSTESLGYWVAYGRVPDGAALFWGDCWWLKLPTCAVNGKGERWNNPSEDTHVFVTTIEGLAQCPKPITSIFWNFPKPNLP